MRADTSSAGFVIVRSPCRYGAPEIGELMINIGMLEWFL